MNLPFKTDILDEAIANRQETQEQERQKILAQVFQWLETVGSQSGIQQAYIFGSLSRAGDFSQTSDVDIAIPGKLPENFCTLMSFLAATVGREVDFIELERCHFAHRIREQGILWTKTRSSF